MIYIKSLVVLLLISNWTTAHAKANSIDVWTRAKGYHGGDNPPVKINAVSIKMDGLTFVETKRFDLQYQKEMHYRGIYLKDLVRPYKPIVRGMNLMLLHFNNGMIYPLRRDETRDFNRLFIALEYHDQGRWRSDFPAMEAGPARKTKIGFTSNKLVPDMSWALAQATVDGHDRFHPLAHVDSLVGIEFVDAEAYYAQFRSDSPHTRLRGRVVYFIRCQYCHSVGGVGATFGRDFLGDQPLATTHQAKDLLELLRPEGKSAQTKVLMPHQPDMTRSDARRLAQWLEQISRHKQHDYLPFYHDELQKVLKDKQRK